jgi:hypothetical protein
VKTVLAVQPVSVETATVVILAIAKSKAVSKWTALFLNYIIKID